MRNDPGVLPRAALEIRPAHRHEYAAIEAFYSTRNYTTPIADADYVVAAFDGQTVVGAVRLCEEGGALVLRGMQVADAMQGQGVGSSMLGILDTKIGKRECWCIPLGKSNIDLERFYSRIGFRRVQPSDAPEFLQDRLREYSKKGEFFIMKSDKPYNHSLDLTSLTLGKST